jgi:DNA-3-methyladenine glycosylase II
LADIVNQKDIKRLIKIDRIFELINDRYGNPPNWKRPQGFISLSRIILEQQVSLASANAHFIKLSSYLNDFTPSEILRLTDVEMRNCQISRQKAKYLQALSGAIINGSIDLEKLSESDEADVRKQLIALKGIGNWTADIYLMFCLQAKNIFPSGDVAIVNTVKELTDVVTKEDIVQLAEKWQPLRSLASYFFWHYYLSKKNEYLE